MKTSMTEVAMRESAKEASETNGNKGNLMENRNAIEFRVFLKFFIQFSLL